MHGRIMCGVPGICPPDARPAPSDDSHQGLGTPTYPQLGPAALVAGWDPGRLGHPVWPSTCRGTRQWRYKLRSVDQGERALSAHQHLHCRAARVTPGLASPCRPGGTQRYRSLSSSWGFYYWVPREMQLHSQKYPCCCESGSCLSIVPLYVLSCTPEAGVCVGGGMGLLGLGRKKLGEKTTKQRRLQSRKRHRNRNTA